MLETAEKTESIIQDTHSHNPREVLVKVENLGKIFCRDLKKSLWYGLKDSVGALLPGTSRTYEEDGTPVLRKDEFWANKGINFELRRGECIGLVGHNGAGKTTLLKMLNGLIKPDTGRIEMRGRVGALIALGAGFNPILTGRENVYINGSILGFSKKEIEAKYDEIVAFAEMEDFMETPVQNYSSGMQVRLGFAVAAGLEPDILIVDEVLAVGDIGFRIRCLNRIHELLPKTAVIFVSHAMPMVARICNKGILLDHGCVKAASNEVAEVIDAYYACFDQGETSVVGSGAAEVVEIKFVDQESDTPLIPFGAPLTIRMQLKLHTEASNIRVRLAVFNQDQRAVLDIMNENMHSFVWKKIGKKLELVVTIPCLHLAEGNHAISVIIADDDSVEVLCRMDNALKFQMGHHTSTGADALEAARWQVQAVS